MTAHRVTCGCAYLLATVCQDWRHNGDVNNQSQPRNLLCPWCAYLAHAPLCHC